MNKIQRALEIFRNDGFVTLLKRSLSYLAPNEIYNKKIWPLLPVVEDYGTYNGVKVKGIEHKLLDNLVPWSTPSKISDFKKINIEQILQNYNEGDEVTIIGGGKGVTAVHTARIVGKNGNVRIYEANEERVEQLKKRR